MFAETLRLTLEPSPLAPREARRVLGKWLEQSSCDEEQQADLLLVISELVSNAVVHAGSRPDVLASFDDGRIRLEVHDSHQAPPVERASMTVTEPGGLDTEVSFRDDKHAGHRRPRRCRCADGRAPNSVPAQIEA